MTETSGSQNKEVSEDDARTAAFQSIYNRFVHMVLCARVENGTWTDEDDLVAFTVFMKDPILVQINCESFAWTPPICTRTVAAGEMIEPSDLRTQSVKVEASWEAGPLVKAERRNGSWLLRLSLRRQNPRVQRLAAVADEFLETARRNLDDGRLRAFTENAFHAVEALAKAELLSYPMAATEVEDSRRHTGLLSAYHLWARLGNTDQRFPRLLQELLELRSPATYADGEFVADEMRARSEFATLVDLRLHVDEVVAGRVGGVVRVIATRELSAGELVTRSDAAIRPLKSAARSAPRR